MSEIILAGPIALTTPALHEAVRREIPIAWMSSGFWFLATTGARGPRSATARRAQYGAAADPARALRFAQELVAARIRNQCTLLRRSWRCEAGGRETVLARLRRSISERCPTCSLTQPGYSARLTMRAGPDGRQPTR